MNILVIGSGGREHALCWKLSRSARVRRIWCAPGNGGTSGLATNVPIKAIEIEKLADFAAANAVGLTIVGPEAPLCDGIVDVFAARGLRIFGPNLAAARLEGSKVFAKEIMVRMGVPTARSGRFTDPEAALGFGRELGWPHVVKADGLAAGKGAIVVTTPNEADAALRQILVERAFGAAGDQVLIEEFLEGEEASLQLLVSGTDYLVLPTSQDHKRVGDGDSGPNTGGMGAYSPAPVLDGAALKEAERTIVRPLLDGLPAAGIDFRGVLYIGLMIGRDGPKVLEFNCRFGDPETEVLLPRIETDLVDLFEACIEGRLGGQRVALSRDAALCVVAAAPGYPGEYPVGAPIEGLDAAGADGAMVFHAGTRCDNGGIVTSGGRVLAVTATGSDLGAARDRAYAAIEKIRFSGMHFRRDVGRRALGGR